MHLYSSSRRRAERFVVKVHIQRIVLGEWRGGRIFPERGPTARPESRKSVAIYSARNFIYIHYIVVLSYRTIDNRHPPPLCLTWPAPWQKLQFPGQSQLVIDSRAANHFKATSFVRWRGEDATSSRRRANRIRKAQTRRKNQPDKSRLNLSGAGKMAPKGHVVGRNISTLIRPDGWHPPPPPPLLSFREFRLGALSI